MATHQAVGLRVGSHALGDVRTANQRATGLTEERVQRIRHLLRDLEHGGALGSIVSTSLNLAVLATLARILNRALDLLLQALDLSEERRDRVTHGGEMAGQASEVIVPAGLGDGIR